MKVVEIKEELKIFWKILKLINFNSKTMKFLKLILSMLVYGGIIAFLILAIMSDLYLVKF